MAISSEDIVLRRPQMVTSTGANGGKMSHVQIPTGALNVLFDEVFEAQRTVGITQWRKVYWHLAHPSNEGMKNVLMYLYSPPAGDAKCLIAEGTFTDVQDDLSTPRLYGVGTLETLASVGDTEVRILTQGQTYNAFQVGDKVAVHNRADPNDTTGYREFHTVTAVAWNGDEATLTLADALSHEFPTVRDLDGISVTTRVSSCLEAGTVQGALVGEPTLTSALGAIDNTGDNQIVVDAVGGITDTFTITFTSSTAFGCTNSAGTEVGSGNRTTPFEPQNPDFVGRPYLTIPPNFWSGTWAAGNTLVLSTNPPAVPTWLYLDVPPNADPVDATIFYMLLTGNTL